MGEGGQRGTDNNMLKATLERVEVHQKVQIQQDEAGNSFNQHHNYEQAILGMPSICDRFLMIFIFIPSRVS